VPILAIINGGKGRVNQNVPVVYRANVRGEIMMLTHLTRSDGSLSLIQLRAMLKDVSIPPLLIGANLAVWYTTALMHVDVVISESIPKSVWVLM
jgi:hypothetical protein